MVNEWHGRISAMIDKSCMYCGMHQVEYVEHMFFNYPITQHAWCYATNIIQQLSSKRGNLGPWKSFSMMQCLFDRSLNKSLKTF